MKIVDNKALLLTLRNPSRVTSVIPKSRELPNNQVLVNWGLEEKQVLRNMKINAPSPIESNYKWTGKYTPFDHQKVTSSFLTLNRKSFCFNEQGTGKTASAIWASDYLLKQGAINRVLVVCPLLWIRHGEMICLVLLCTARLTWPTVQLRNVRR